MVSVRPVKVLKWLRPSRTTQTSHGNSTETPCSVYSARWINGYNKFWAMSVHDAPAVSGGMSSYAMRFQVSVGPAVLKPMPCPSTTQAMRDKPVFRCFISNHDSTLCTMLAHLAAIQDKSVGTGLTVHDIYETRHWPWLGVSAWKVRLPHNFLHIYSRLACMICWYILRPASQSPTQAPLLTW